MSTAAATPDEYIASLPPERREALKAVRAVLRKSLEAGFEEGMEFGMISYFIPLSRYPRTYNGRPLGIATLASQKDYMALYLMSVYGDDAERERFEKAYRATGKPFDMGKACVRFRTLADLPLDVVEETLRRVTVDGYIRRYEEIRSRTAAGARNAGKASPDGGRTRAAGKHSPTGEARKPAGEARKPAGEARKPAGEARKPAGKATRPTPAKPARKPAPR